MGPSKALSSVLIPIGDSCPWPGLSSYAHVGLSRILTCKLLFFSCKWSNVNFRSSSQGPGMAGRVLRLNLKWNALIFLASTHPIPSYLAPSPFPRSPKRAIANDLWWQPVLGDRPRDLESGRPGAWASGLCSGIPCCRLLFPKAILTTDFVYRKALLCL